MIETRCNRTACLQLSDSDDAQNLGGGQEVKSGYGRVAWAITRRRLKQEIHYACLKLSVKAQHTDPRSFKSTEAASRSMRRFLTMRDIYVVTAAFYCFKLFFYVSCDFVYVLPPVSLSGTHRVSFSDFSPWALDELDDWSSRKQKQNTAIMRVC